ARRRRVARWAERDLLADLPLLPLVLPHEVSRVVLEDALQPGKPFALGAAVKAIEAAIRFHHRLLHEVRGIRLRPQPAFDPSPAHQAEALPPPSAQFIYRAA